MRIPQAKRVVFGLALLGLLVAFDTTLCPTAGLFGIPCPSCGLTRATLALARLDPAAAAALHPGVFLVLPYVVAWGLGEYGSHRVRRRLGFGADSPRFAWAGIALIVLLTLLWLARFRGFFGGPVSVRRWY